MTDGSLIRPDWRIGFACHWLTVNERGQPDHHPLRRLRSTTRKFLLENDRRVALGRLGEIAVYNLTTLQRILIALSALPRHRRMFRIGSDLLPLHTLDHPVVHDFYNSEGWKAVSSRLFKEMGEFAATHGIRLSFHPGQFTVLNSLKPGVQDAAIREIEAVADIVEQMGGVGWHRRGWAINIHVGSGHAEGLDDFARGWSRLSLRARGMLTVENDEFSWGLNDLVHLWRLCERTSGFGPALVPDLHHHWIKTGRYLNPENPKLHMLTDTWANPRGGSSPRPKMHLSMSPCEHVEWVCYQHIPRATGTPDWAMDLVPLHYPHLPPGHLRGMVNVGLLRTHSDGVWHRGVLDWALAFWDRWDIMLEAKLKNLAVDHVAARAEEIYGTGEDR